MGISQENKIIANIIRKNFMKRPEVYKYYDNDRKSSIDIAISENGVYKGVTSYSTIGLSDYNIGFKYKKNIPLRVEFLGVCTNEIDYFANIMATCAFNIINSKFKCYPGVVFKNVIYMYNKNLNVKHILFCPPYLWNHKFKNVYFEIKTVAWLMMIPISDKELIYLNDNGADALEDLFKKKDVDISDLERESLL